jgi:hypothetical protein
MQFSNEWVDKQMRDIVSTIPFASGDRAQVDEEYPNIWIDLQNGDLVQGRMGLDNALL